MDRLRLNVVIVVEDQDDLLGLADERIDQLRHHLLRPVVSRARRAMAPAAR